MSKIPEDGLNGKHIAGLNRIYEIRNQALGYGEWLAENEESWGQFTHFYFISNRTFLCYALRLISKLGFSQNLLKFYSVISDKS